MKLSSVCLAFSLTCASFAFAAPASAFAPFPLADSSHVAPAPPSAGPTPTVPDARPPGSSSSLPQARLDPAGSPRQPAALADTDQPADFGPHSTSVAAQTSYSDVAAADTHRDNIRALARRGIFAGTDCGPNLFCPGEPIDRATMAVWVVRVLDGQDPPPGSSRFPDANSQLPRFYLPFIERLAELGVTKGCGNGTNFCPLNPVTRAQMAVFLTRAFNLPDGPDPDFVDVPDRSWYEDQVAALAASTITRGCAINPARYCPEQSTTRAQMATFLYRGAGPGYMDRVFESPDPEALPSAGSNVGKRDYDVAVYYCGSNEEYDAQKLSDIVGDLTAVSLFFARESRDNSSVSFYQGKRNQGVLSPDPDGLFWSDPLADWDVDHSGHRKCMDAAGQSKDILILADVPTGGILGYAYLGKRAPFAATLERHNDDKIDFLATVAHEVGHAFYHLSHPWNEKLVLCDDIDLDKVSLDDAEDCRDARSTDKEDLTNTAIEHILHSLMSYVDFGAVHDVDPHQGYIACYQAAALDWKEECDHGPFAPHRPSAPNLAPRVESLTVRWFPPDEDGDERITDYDVRFRRSGADGWTDWPHDGTSQHTTITGLAGGARYDVRVRARNRVGPSDWSRFRRATTLEEEDGHPSVTVDFGDSAEGELTEDGRRCSEHCRWLHIEFEGFGPGPHTLLCAHNGIHQTGTSGGAWHSAEVYESDSPITRECFFGYPGNKVFVVVDATRDGDVWRGGTFSEPLAWPGSDDSPVAFDAGSAVGNRWNWNPNSSQAHANCQRAAICRNVGVSNLSDLGGSPYQLECWTEGDTSAGWSGSWSGANNSGCYYWPQTEITIYVKVNGIESNRFVLEPESGPPDGPVAFDAGSAVGNRWNWNPNSSQAHANCQRAAICRNVGVSNLSDLGGSPYQLECWTEGDTSAGWSGSWSGANNSGCYYWPQTEITVYVKVNGIESNRFVLEPESGPPDGPVAFDAGSAVGNRWNWNPNSSQAHANCQRAAICRNVGVSNLSDLGGSPYQLECWTEGDTSAGWSGSWSGANNSGCYYWPQTEITVYVKVNGVESNRLVLRAT